MIGAFEASTEGIRKPGNMRLSPEGQSFKQPWKGSVQCIVLHFSYPPIVASTWDDEIPRILKPAKIMVFMDTYVKDLNPGTTGAIITEPR